MTQRAITVLLTAVTGPYVANMGRAAGATASVGTAAAGAQAKTGALGGAMGGLTGKLLAGGGLVFAMKQGVDLLTSYEDALVGVGKTTGLTGDELSRLGDDLTQLAIGIEGSAEDMLGIAQSAAQLGVSNDNIVEFTEVIANMASATDLTVDSAATDMARLSNILGRPIEDVEALGSVVVALGNTMATTEPEILNLSTRLAAAGRTAGITDAEVVGLAAAMSALGVEAEAGGTAMSRVLNEITRAVASGSEKLDAFAATAGMSAKDFTQAWSDEPAAALQLFLDGLGQLSDAERFGVMEELGLDAARLTDVLLRTSSGADGLAVAFERANRAEAENVALAEEAEVANQRLSVAIEGLGDELARQGREFLGNEEGARTAAEGVNWFTRNLENILGPLRNTFSPLSTMAEQTADVGTVASLTADQQVLLGDAIRGTGNVAEGTTPKVFELAESHRDASEQSAAHLEQSILLADQLAEQRNPVFALTNALDAVRQAEEKYQTVIEEHGRNSKEAEDASWELFEAIEGVTEASLRVGPGGFDQAIQRVDALAASGEITTAQADTLRTMLLRAKDAAGEFSGDYRMSLRVDMPAADQALLNSAQRLAGTSGATTTISVPVGARAHGGPVSAGGMYLVGEQGPELFSPSTSGSILPAGQTSRMMSGGGGGTVIHNYFPNYVGSKQDITDAVKDGLAQDARRGGTVVANVARQ